MTKLTKYQEAALQYDRHISLTANAGSGKTFVLSKRYVDIVSNENINISNIIAITFTDKAAGELYKKIAGEIETRLIECDDQKKKWKLERIRSQLVSANISTIHSFCTGLLREFPVEAGIDANFQAIDSSVSDELIEISIEDCLNKGIQSEQSETIKELIRFFGSKKMFEKELKKLVLKRKNILKISESIYQKDEKEISEFFRQNFLEIAQKVLGKELEIVSDIRLINDIVLSYNSDNQIAVDINYELNIVQSEIDFIKKLKCLRSISENMLILTGKVKQKGYLKKNFFAEYDSEISNIEKFFAELKNFEISDNYEVNEFELAKIGKKILSIHTDIVKLYEDRKYKNGYLDFEDLLIYALKIIQKENVKNYLSEKFKYIMIDEFQDTDEIQYNIIMPVLDNLKRNNLFIVGDEKQSIYMFRDAELKIFNKTRDEIRDSSGDKSILSLPHSFRVSPHIALFTNQLFLSLFKDHQELYNEVCSSELICAKKEDEPGGIEFLIADKDGEIDESDLVSDRILSLATGELDISFGDITILCKKRKDFIKLEESLSGKKIPYSIVGGKGFYQRQVIYDIFNYLQFLIDSKNDAALAGILRSPFFMVSDTEIYLINKESGNSFFKKLVNYSGKNTGTEAIVLKLKSYLAIAQKIEINELLRKLLVESGYWTVVAAKPNGDQELANLEKFISLSVKFSKNSFKSLYDFIEYLDEAIETDEDEGQAQISAEDNSVKIMTIHKSKGLEFKAVFLYNSNDFLRDTGIKARSLLVDNDFGILTKVPYQKNYYAEYESAPIIGAVNYIQKRKNLAEAKRLLYVGITRAINYLFVSATVSKNKSKENSFLDMICSGLGVDLESSEFDLSSKLEFLEVQNDINVDVEKVFSVSMPITKTIETEEVFTGNFEKEVINKQLYLDEINDNIKNEFISATKLAIYNQCPVKYELNYEYGYSRLFNMFNDSNKNYEFENKNREEGESDKLPANIKGLISHKALEVCADYNDCVEKIDDIISREVSQFEFDETKIKNVKAKILSELEKYYESDSFKEISKFARSKNEFEVYAKEGEFFLYGIIDKLMYDSETLIIVDYKTDEVDKESLLKKSENYLPQLKFYAYTLSKVFPRIKNYELWLSFIKVPEQIIKWKLSANELKEFKLLLEKYIKNTVNLSFEPNLKHCDACNFYADKSCVKSKFA
ncbi:MAG: UvrD-helicase domain-containing protein [Melioribacteraceae bacterium]|nr:UvrD-helicase domain-containing protein [Melioribacteraceae bacterium]